MHRNYGPDGVLIHAFSPEGRVIWERRCDGLMRRGVSQSRFGRTSGSGWRGYRDVVRNTLSSISVARFHCARILSAPVALALSER